MDTPPREPAAPVPNANQLMMAMAGQDGMTEEHDMADHNNTADQNDKAPTVLTTFYEDPENVKQLNDLKNVALGNARMLYGSEQGKFYDIVPGVDKSGEFWAAALTCAMGGSLKIMRQENRDGALEAVRALVASLVKDTGDLLLVKYHVGFTLTDQQGYTNPDTNKFELDPKAKNEAPQEGRPVDDTGTLRFGGGAFGGGRGGRGGGGGGGGRGGDRYTPSRPPSGPRAERMGEPELKRKRVVYEEPE